MFAEERRQRIIELLEKQFRITVTELTESLEVSEATVRRDLQELEAQGMLKRTHGGAMIDSPSHVELSFQEKEITALEEKKQIAKLAASFVEDGDTIILDAGTTVLQMIPHILHKKVTVITNSLMAAAALSQSDSIELIVTGGRNRYKTKALVGDIVNRTFAMFHADKVFLGVNGVDLVHGITTPTIDERGIKKQMVESAKEVFVLADYSKFYKISFAKIAPIEEVDCIITDSKIEKSTIDKYDKLGIKVVF